MHLEQLKTEFKLRYSYIHLANALIPGASTNSDIRQIMGETGTWIDTAPEAELRNKADQVISNLDRLLTLLRERLPSKRDWREIAAEHWNNCSQSNFSFSNGVSCGWLVERFDCSLLNIPADMPYHARIGVGHHAGNAAIEEDFLLRDAFFMLAKCQMALAHLQGFGATLKTESPKKSRYKMISMLNQNVATYARCSVLGFYSFVECFVNSVGEDFVARHPHMPSKACDILRGKKDGRYLSIEKKVEVFPSLLRPDGRRPIVLSDSSQLAEPYKSFVTYIKEIRDSSTHFAKNKADIIVPPQVWEERAKNASTVCLSVARGFWNACYPDRQLPLYLGQLDDKRHLQIAEQRAQTERE